MTRPAPARHLFPVWPAEERADGPPTAAPPYPDDDRMAERIGLALRATGYRALRAVEVTAHGQTIRLAGRIPSYYLKSVAQATVRAVYRSALILNQLEVKPPS